MQEKRQFPRKPVDVAVVITVEDTGETLEGRTRDMSIGGVFVITEGKAAFGAKVKMTVQAPGEPLVFSALVRWTANDGLGLQFQALGARETHQIVQWVTSRK